MCNFLGADCCDCKIKTQLRGCCRFVCLVIPSVHLVVHTHTCVFACVTDRQSVSCQGSCLPKYSVPFSWRELSKEPWLILPRRFKKSPLSVISLRSNPSPRWQSVGWMPVPTLQLLRCEIGRFCFAVCSWAAAAWKIDFGEKGRAANPCSLLQTPLGVQNGRARQCQAIAERPGGIYFSVPVVSPGKALCPFAMHTPRQNHW